MASFRTTKQKITIGYVLLLAILLFSLVFVYHEMENLSTADDMQELKTDSLVLLLREKDENTIQMLRILSQANDSLLSASEIREIITGQDSLIARQRVQNRVITQRDSLITKPKKKGFFKRLAEAFVPSKKDSAVLINTSSVVATDTILEPSGISDSLQQKIRQASRDKRSQRKTIIRRNSATYQRVNDHLTSRMDSLIKNYEEETLLRSQQDAALQQAVRMRSARIIGGIAVGAVLLSAFFLILIRRDITRSNRYRQQLEDANKRAEALLDAREKLMLAITHDFKAPLGSIMGYVELLSRLTQDERQRFYLDNMKGSSTHLLKLVNDLLDFHRLDLNKAEVNRVPFTPHQLFEEITTSFQPMATNKGLTLDCRIVHELSGQFAGDPLRIHQIASNLLSNAIKFTQKGSITLEASYTTSRLVMKVSDTGKGMTSEDKQRIFKEFTRLPGAQGEEGFGLGLSIVHKLVNLLGGNIEVQSALDKGTCFTVVLPLYPLKEKEVVNVHETPDQPEKRQDRTEEDTAVDDLSALSLRKNLRILLIDDDKLQLDLTAAMLKLKGIDSVCCQQLEELTEQLRTSAFDILLTDIQMPAINGFDLVKLLRTSNIPQAKSIPIIAVTARREMDKTVFDEYGFAGCLHKPFTVKELLMAVNMGHPSVDIADKTDTPEDTETGLDFSALTAFSEGSPEEAHSIIQTFIEETSKNADRMRQALADKEVDGIVNMAHKLLPLFTLIKAKDALPLLNWLEAKRGQQISEEICTKTERVLEEIHTILKKARKYGLAK